MGFIKRILNVVADLRKEGEKVTRAATAQRLYSGRGGSADANHKSHFSLDLRRKGISFERILALGKRPGELTWEDKIDLSCREPGKASSLKYAFVSVDETGFTFHLTTLNRRGPAKGTFGRPKKLK